MAKFQYKGINSQTGNNVKNTLDAESMKDAKAQLRKLDILPTEIHEVTKSKKKSEKSIANKLFNNVPIIDLAIMTRQFATLQRAGIPLDESLKALSEQVENLNLRSVLEHVKVAVNEGTSLSKAMGEHPNVFNTLYTSMIDAGEHSGKLHTVLERLADFSEYSVQLKNEIMGAIMYPVIMILISLIIIGFLFVMVLPKITQVLISMKVPLPFATKAVIWLSNFLQEDWYIVIIGLFLMAYLFNKWINSKRGRPIWHRALLNAPLFGEITRKSSISRFAKTFSTLLISGVPVVQALDIVKNVIDNVIIREVVSKTKTAVIEGQALAKPLADSGHFPPLVTHMIQTGERTGQLENMLGHIAETYENEVKHKISSMTSIIEPLMIVMMAGIVAVIIIAILVPMFEVFNSVK